MIIVASVIGTVLAAMILILLWLAAILSLTWLGNAKVEHIITTGFCLLALSIAWVVYHIL